MYVSKEIYLLTKNLIIHMYILSFITYANVTTLCITASIQVDIVNVSLIREKSILYLIVNFNYR